MRTLVRGDVVLSTIHGSHLYGTTTETSDIDQYKVYWGKGKSTQVIKNGTDTTTDSFESFIRKLYRGIPYQWEAFFSQKKTLNLNLLPLLNSIRPDFSQMHKSYGQTIHNLLDMKEEKRTLRAYHIAYNFSTYMRIGFFNQTLTLNELKYLKEMIEQSSDHEATIADVFKIQ